MAFDAFEPASRWKVDNTKLSGLEALRKLNRIECVHLYVCGYSDGWHRVASHHAVSMQMTRKVVKMVEGTSLSD